MNNQSLDNDPKQNKTQKQNKVLFLKIMRLNKRMSHEYTEYMGKIIF